MHDQAEREGQQAVALIETAGRVQQTGGGGRGDGTGRFVDRLA